MAAQIHAILVTRTHPVAVEELRVTLEALHAQTRPTERVTIVVCGDLAPVRDLVATSGATNVVSIGATAPFAAAVRHGMRQVDSGYAVWLLPHDAAPDPDALSYLAAALERGPSIAVAAPKLVDRTHRDRIVSLGQSQTRTGKLFERASGDYDQGQYDALDDVLGADVRGMLIRAELRDDLLPDPALLSVDEGLDIGVRAHLAGLRVTLVPLAVIAVPTPPRQSASVSYLERAAQLHRRLVYARGPMVVVHWLLLLPLALFATALHLLAKQPWRIPGEWVAAVVVMVRVGAIYRARRAVNRIRTRSWYSLEPLIADRDQLRQRIEDPVPAADRHSLGFFSGGGAWAVLTLAAVNIAAFVALLSWPGVAGGALMPLRDTVGGLWAEAAAGLSPEGVHSVQPADPFSAVVALLGSLWPISPSLTLLALWLTALPLAGVGAWFAATRMATRATPRVVVAVAWALAPSLLQALIDPRPAAVLAHILLPWVVFAALAAHRSWASAGVGSLLIAALAATAPSLIPALAVIWAFALVLTVTFRARSFGKVLWLAVPTAAAFLPLVTQQIPRGNPLGLLADPGPVYASGVPSYDSAGVVLLGFPQEGFGGWTTMLAAWGVPHLAWAVPLLFAPFLVLALFAPVLKRWRVGIGSVFVALLGLATAYVAPAVMVSHDSGTAVGLWPGNGLALAWLAVCCAAAVTLDVIPVPTAARVSAASVALVAIAVLAVPALTSVHRGEAVVTSGGESTLPAFVSAQSASANDVGTFILIPTEDGSLAARVVWGTSETLGGASTLSNTSIALDEDDEWVADQASELVSAGSTRAPAALAERGIGFVLVAPAPAASGGGISPLDSTATVEQRATADAAALVMDSRAQFVRVGETDRGTLWRYDEEVAARAGLTGDEQGQVAGIVTTQLVTLAAALLLAIPTPASIRAGRRTSRVLGADYEVVR